VFEDTTLPGLRQLVDELAQPGQRGVLEDGNASASREGNRFVSSRGGVALPQETDDAARRAGQIGRESRKGKEKEAATGATVASRRRHTRLVSDWSSDVCSSDLSSRTPRCPGCASSSTSWRSPGSVVSSKTGMPRLRAKAIASSVPAAGSLFRRRPTTRHFALS